MLDGGATRSTELPHLFLGPKFQVLAIAHSELKGRAAMPRIRKVIEEYGSCCEHLLSIPLLERPLSEDELRLIQYYVVEMEKKFDGVLTRQSDDKR